MAREKKSVEEGPEYTEGNVLVISLKSAPDGLYNKLVLKARAWIVNMVPRLDNENGPDFWCWIETHYFDTRGDTKFDTFFLFDKETEEVLGTASCVPEDREVGSDYGIPGVWGGGLNIKESARGKGVLQVLRRLLDKHLSNVAHQEGKPIWFNLFTQDSALAEVLRHGGYEIPQRVMLNGARVKNLNVLGKLYVLHFDQHQWWARKLFTPGQNAQGDTPKETRPICFTLRFKGAEGETRYRYTNRPVQPSVLVKNVRRLREIRPQDRNRAVVEIATRLGNIEFGDQEILIGRRASRQKYFSELCAANPLIFKLTEAPQQLRVQIRSQSAKKTRKFDLGHFHGYSTVVPCTAIAYSRFLENKFEPLELGPKDVVHGSKNKNTALILSARDSLGSTEHLFIEGYAHIPSLMEGATLNPDAQESLIAHLGAFIHEGIELTPDENTVKYRDSSKQRRLPVIFCYANGTRQEELLSEMGFRRAPFDEEQAWPKLSARIKRSRPYKLPKFIFDFLEFNRLKPLAKLKAKMRIAIKLFIRYRYPEGRALRMQKSRDSVG